MPTHTSRPRLRASVAGVTAVFTGLAAGQLVASFVAPEAAPALAVGSPRRATDPREPKRPTGPKSTPTRGA